MRDEPSAPQLAPASKSSTPPRTPLLRPARPTVSIAARIQRPVIRTVHIPPSSAPGAPEADAAAALANATQDPPTVTLLDTKSAEGGGSGETFDWSIAAAIAPQHDFLMAGGLDPDNVARAIAQVQPWGVDVSSGVEAEGVKDPAKIQAFLSAARAAQKAASA
jgi:phosphoribosylanthranilate isomerase